MPLLYLGEGRRGGTEQSWRKGEPSSQALLDHEGQLSFAGELRDLRESLEGSRRKRPTPSNESLEPLYKRSVEIFP